MALGDSRDARRLLRLKQTQTLLARADADAAQQLATRQREEAAALRDMAAQAVDAARPKAETGLSLAMLQQRLRTLAVARAYAMENALAAADLETRAVQNEEQGRMHLARATRHHRKERKLGAWQERVVKTQERQRQRRQYQNHTEEFQCRSTFSR